MIEQRTITIDGQEYILTQFPATKGLRILKQIVKLLGPSFAELSKGNDSAEGQDNVNSDVVAAALEKLFDNLDEVDVENLVKDLMTSVSKGSIAINFDMEFSGAYLKLFKLSKEVVEFNFGSVFTLVGTGL